MMIPVFICSCKCGVIRCERADIVNVFWCLRLLVRIQVFWDVALFIEDFCNCLGPRRELLRWQGRRSLHAGIQQLILALNTLYPEQMFQFFL